MTRRNERPGPGRQKPGPRLSNWRQDSMHCSALSVEHHSSLLLAVSCRLFITGAEL